MGENEKHGRWGEKVSACTVPCISGPTMKGTDDGHQPSTQDMDAKPVATKPEARVAAQVQGLGSWAIVFGSR